MRFVHVRLVALVLVGAAAVMPATAQLRGPADVEPEAVASGSLAALVRANPRCRSAGNGCQVCAVTAGRIVGCSTPGIACQPSVWQCLQGADADDDARRFADPLP